MARYQELALAAVRDVRERGRRVLLAGGSGLRPGTSVEVEGAEGLTAVVLEDLGGARRLMKFSQPLLPLLPQVGHTPLPPYIHQPLADPERYQTVYAREDGSAAAPTAGLHFTPELLLRLREQGVDFAFLTLHVGLDTFAPVTEDEAESHHIHTEWCELSAETARRINQARLAGRRVVAVGTTSVRVLESAALASLRQAQAEAGPQLEACPWRPVVALNGPTALFILPGYRFRAVDALITNFHLPRSTLFMLVSAFAGRETILRAYQAAIAERYRFYSFGDAMVIV